MKNNDYFYLYKHYQDQVSKMGQRTLNDVLNRWYSYIKKVKRKEKLERILNEKG